MAQAILAQADLAQGLGPGRSRKAMAPKKVSTPVKPSPSTHQRSPKASPRGQDDDGYAPRKADDGRRKTSPRGQPRQTRSSSILPDSLLVPGCADSSKPRFAIVDVVLKQNT